MENSLINETSPYLLQHAHNPVNWYAWNQESLDKAKQEDKPIIVSIGYSTCHWCHVMERESFEKEDIAKVMNEHFVCIKVDREERPDVDQVYMEALHSMGLQGGWPLNVFLTPEQKPFYGGTYFPAQGWKELLLNVAEVFDSKREQLEASALKFVEAIKGNKFPGGEVGSSSISADSLDTINSNLIKGFDTVKGGTGSAPKFPMPVIWKYIIQYLSNEDHKELSDQLHLTLEKIALGGIYDQIGGGFARYSTDADWFAPHFEKMLYDNGQLLSLYAQAYKLRADPLYKDAVYQTVEWLKREMTASNGAFYSALDADSEGIEGKFYVWTESELKNCLKEQFDLAKSYYNTTPSGNWENGWNILHRNTDDTQFGKENSLEISELKRNIHFINDKLLNCRSPRIRPGLDDKILIGWNALMSKGLLDAFSAFGDEEFLRLAIKNIDYILSDLLDGDIVYHSAGKKINGFLDDYALLIELLIEAYQVTFDEKYLIKAKSLTDQCIGDFFDKEDQFFFYTSRGSERLIADKKELYDNVIPASNSIMCSNLYKLGILFEEPQYVEKSKVMLYKLIALTEREPRYMTNWAVTVAQMVNPPFEIIIIGEKAKEYRSELAKHKLPGHLFLGSTNSSGSALSMLENRDAIDGQTTIYVCQNKTCQLPVQSVEEALGQMI